MRLTAIILRAVSYPILIGLAVVAVVAVWAFLTLGDRVAGRD